MAQPIYKVIFQNQGKVYEVYARQIFQSDMWGFIEIEEFIFGERSQILVPKGIWTARLRIRTSSPYTKGICRNSRPL